MELHTISAIILTAACCISEILFLRARSQGRHWLAFGLKGLASLSFCLIGFLTTLVRYTPYLIPLGLLMGFLGDQLLAMRKLYPQYHDSAFLLGALSFSLGHCFYLAALAGVHKGLLHTALWIFPVLLVLSELFAHAGGFAKHKMHLPGLLYIAIEAAMCSAALALWYETRTAFSVIFALAGVSFLISDNLLCACSFGRLKNKPTDFLLHLTYLTAQLLISWSPLSL